MVISTCFVLLFFFGGRMRFCCDKCILIPVVSDMVTYFCFQF